MATDQEIHDTIVNVDSCLDGLAIRDAVSVLEQVKFGIMFKSWEYAKIQYKKEKEEKK
uniref:Uncharacterized protein n=1 Tax=viral metagenome TaxID=1070528 RepID=A0A6H2A179_9ZZZZ